jgi:hypothetical protein
VDFGFAVEEPQAPEGTLSSAHVHSFRRIPKIATSVSAKSCSLFGGGGSHPEPPPCRSGRTFRRKTFGPGGRRRGWTFFLLLLSDRGRPLSAVFQRLPSPVGSLHNRERNYAISDGKITMFSLNNSKYCFNRRLINYVNNKV